MFVTKILLAVGVVIVLYSFPFLTFFSFSKSLFCSGMWLVGAIFLVVVAPRMLFCAVVVVSRVERKVNHILDRFLEMLSSMVL